MKPKFWADEPSVYDVKNLQTHKVSRNLVSSLRQLRGPGGAYRIRTDDPLLAKQMLYQLS